MTETLSDIAKFYGKDNIFFKAVFSCQFLVRCSLEILCNFIPLAGIRKILYGWMGVRLGKGSWLGTGILFDKLFPHLIEIGERSAIGDRCIIFAHAVIPSATDLREIYPLQVKPVVIENDVWVMPGVVIAPGSHIGQHCVIATGSVLRGRIAPYSLVAGNPARVVKSLKHHFEKSEPVALAH